MSNIINDEQKSDLRKILELPDSNETFKIFEILETYMKEPLLPLKAVNINTGDNEINFSSNAQSVKKSVLSRLNKISELSQKLKKEVDLLDHAMISRLSEHISLNLVEKQRLPTHRQHIPISPQVLLDVISESTGSIEIDFKQAYPSKYDKLIDGLIDFWMFTLRKEKPRKYTDDPFIAFLAIITGLEEDSAYKAYRKYINNNSDEV